MFLATLHAPLLRFGSKYLVYNWSTYATVMDCLLFMASVQSLSESNRLLVVEPRARKPCCCRVIMLLAFNFYDERTVSIVGSVVFCSFYYHWSKDANRYWGYWNANPVTDILVVCDGMCGVGLTARHPRFPRVRHPQPVSLHLNHDLSSFQSSDLRLG